MKYCIDIPQKNPTIVPCFVVELRKPIKTYRKPCFSKCWSFISIQVHIYSNCDAFHIYIYIGIIYEYEYLFIYLAVVLRFLYLRTAILHASTTIYIYIYYIYMYIKLYNSIYNLCNPRISVDGFFPHLVTKKLCGKSPRPPASSPWGSLERSSGGRWGRRCPDQKKVGT